MQWTVANVVRSHAAARPGAPMITFGERTVTYGEMAARAARIAQAGVRPQDRVAFLDKNGLEYFEVLFGGGMANVVNPRAARTCTPPRSRTRSPAIPTSPTWR